MPFKDTPCQVCSGQRQIEIGRNIDDKREKVTICPFCCGKGVLHINYKYDCPGSDKWWKRMSGGTDGYQSN